MQELIVKTVDILAPVVLSAISALASWGLYELTKYLRTKTKNDNVNDAISHVCHTVDTTVKELEQEVVKALKARTSDGRLTKEDAAAVKSIAVRRVTAQIPPKIAKIMPAAVTSFGNFISAKIEKAVLELKR